MLQSRPSLCIAQKQLLICTPHHRWTQQRSPAPSVLHKTWDWLQQPKQTKMQHSMSDLYKLQTEKHKNQVHLKGANTAMKRHVAGMATIRPENREGMVPGGRRQGFAELEAEKVHVDYCQLEVFLWLPTILDEKG